MRAYVAAARGAFADAERRATSLLGASDDTAMRAALTLGSVYRQTDRHALARPLDERVLAGSSDPEMRAHARISLAADAVGLGDAAACARHLGAAERLVPTGAWRARVRLDWVRCERALMVDDAAAAVAHARGGLSRSRRARARRHEAKSLLFLGVALRVAGRRGADDALTGARDIARSVGARPIARVATAMLGSRR